jgi:hypothetical protein
MGWRERFDSEIKKAQQARSRGNEGQARVCARRAAGVIATEFLARRGLAAKGASTMHVLSQLRCYPSFPPEQASLIDALLRQVDAEFNLPPGMDLIAEACRLRMQLLPD